MRKYLLSHAAIITIAFMAAACAGQGKTRAAEPLSKSMWPRLVAISVADIDNSIGWYARILNFEVTQRYDFPEDNMSIAFMNRDGFEIELIELANSAPYNAPNNANPSSRRGFNKLAFQSNDIASLHERVVSKGATMQTSLRGSNRTNEQYFIMLDPDGNWIQVFGE